jgi:N-acetylglucosaminyl-diphospho-decaprenol L-rhamnosyltransferase
VCSDVIIVTHNAGHLLGESVASAVTQVGARRVWVIDAESTDGSVEALRTVPETRGDKGDLKETAAPEEQVHLISVPNSGYAAANNRGLAVTRSPFALLLNPDAVLQAGALAALERTARTHPRAGIVGALILNTDGTVQAGSYGRFPSLVTRAGLRLQIIWQRLWGPVARPAQVPTSTKAVDWVTGAAMLIRRAAITEVGPLDEGFFLYYEDVDLCRRMRLGGWEVLLEPTARVLHHRGSSSAPDTTVIQAYRDSFYRYCDLHGLWGLKAAARLGLALRRLKERTP